MSEAEATLGIDLAPARPVTAPPAPPAATTAPSADLSGPFFKLGLLIPMSLAQLAWIVLLYRLARGLVGA
jgi:hypothetical protein